MLVRGNSLCFYSHFSMTKTLGRWYAKLKCTKCIGETDLGKGNCQKKLPSTVRIRPSHSRLVKSFEDDGNYKSVLTTGQPVCPWDQYFDIFNNQCKTKRHNK